MSQPDRSPGAPLPRRLRRVGGAFVLLAIAVVAYGLGSRAAQNSRLHDLTEAQAVPVVAIVTPTQVENQAGLDLPGRLRSLHPCAHLRARPGVPEELEVRHRRQGEGGRRARRNRYARSRPAAHAGARRPERRPGQCQARANHRGALAVAGQHRRRRQARRRPRAPSPGTPISPRSRRRRRTSTSWSPRKASNA